MAVVRNRARAWLFLALSPLALAVQAEGQATRSTSASAREPYRDQTLPVAARVRDLLGRMTLEEKFWQTFMIPGDLDDSTHDYSHGSFGLQISVAPRGQTPPAEGAAK